jgi:hypothetical protein
MTRDEASNYIAKNARYVSDAPEGRGVSYFVRFPTPYSTRVFFSDDTDDLANKLFNFANSPVGARLWKKITPGAYAKMEISEELEEEDS